MPQNKRNHIGSQKKGEKMDCAKIKLLNFRIHVGNKITQNRMIILYLLSWSQKGNTICLTREPYGVILHYRC